MSCVAAPGSRHTCPHSTPCRASRTGGRAGSAGGSRGGGHTRSKSRSAPPRSRVLSRARDDTRNLITMTSTV